MTCLFVIALRQPGPSNPEVARRVTAERWVHATNSSAFRQYSRHRRCLQRGAIVAAQHVSLSSWLRPSTIPAGDWRSRASPLLLLHRRGRGGGSAQTSSIGPSITQTRFYDQLDVQKVRCHSSPPPSQATMLPRKDWAATATTRLACCRPAVVSARSPADFHLPPF